jgi:hypothetical protein
MPSRPRKSARKPLTDALPEGFAPSPSSATSASSAKEGRRKSRNRPAAAAETEARSIGDSVGIMARKVFEHDIGQSLVGIMAGTAGGLIVAIGARALTVLIPVPIAILAGTYAGLRLTKSIGE